MNAAKIHKRGVYAAVVALLLMAVPFAVSATEGSYVLDDFMGLSKWSQSGWADADVDPDHIIRYVPRIRNGVGIDGEPGLQATLHFKPGGFSQGVVLQSNPGDWSEYDELVVELKLVQDIEDLNVKAKVIIFPDDRWTESGDGYSVALVPGEWVTLRLPLRGDGIWSAETTDTHLANIKAWAVKLYASNIPETSEPVQVIFSRPRLEKAADSVAAADLESGVTVASTFTVPAGTSGTEMVEVAGLTPATSGSHLSLTLTLRPGFVGPTPSLRLQSRPENLFPSYIKATEARDAEGTYYYVELWKANRFTPGTYEAILSLDPQSGLTSIAFGPQGGSRVVEGHLYLFGSQLSDGFVVNQPVADRITLDAFSVTQEPLRLGKPFGMPDRISMRAAAVDDPTPFNWVAREEIRTAGVADELRVAWRGLDTPLPGELVLWLQEGAERTELWRGPVVGEDVILPAQTVPAGRQRIGLAYVDGSYYLDLAEAEIEMMRAFLNATAYITDVDAARSDVGSEVHLSANAAVDGIDVRLKDERGSTVWSGALSIPENDVVAVPVTLQGERVGTLKLEVFGESLEFDPSVPVYWTPEALTSYLADALAGHPVVELDGAKAPTRAELLTAVVELLGLEAETTVTIAADTAKVAAPAALLDDVSEDDWYYNAVVAAKQSGLLGTALLDGNRFDGDATATLGETLMLLTRAREYVIDTLGKAGPVARPRSIQDYVDSAVALGWVDESAAAESPVTWSDVNELVVRAFEEIPAVELVRANPKGLRYVFTGTETYVPEQPYKSVGTFGMWSKGTDARAKGWLGNEHHRGLLTFTWSPAGTGHQLYWYRFHEDAGVLLLGQVELADDPVERTYQVHDHTTAQWTFTTYEDGARVETDVYLSRAFPAVLYVSESELFTWRIDNQEFKFDQLAYFDANGEVQVVALADDGPVELDPDRLAEPWLVLYQEMWSTGELVPMLIRLEHRPSRIVARADAMLQLTFADEAGTVSVMPLYGIRRLKAEAAEWAGALPADALELIDFWSSALAAFPIGTSETYAADQAAGYVNVTGAFRYHKIQDDWGTEPLHIAPVPPVVGLAEETGYPVVWGSNVERSETATFLGPFTFGRGTQVEYALPIYASIDQVYTPVRVSGDERLEALQAEALRHVADRWFKWPSPSLDSTLLASHAVTYSLVDEEEAKAWYKERIAQSLAGYYDERSLDTVIQPASGNSYVYSNKIWAAGEDFDREYYIGRQLVITAQVAHWLGWDVVEPFWDAIRGLYGYYRIHWDWAWQGSTTFNTGFSYQADGVALSWEGMMGFARMARLAGDEALMNDALYRTAALGASLYALWELTDWAMANDYAVMNPGDPNQWVRRRPAEEILTGFLPDTFSEFTGIVTTMPTEWGASNWVHDELMGRTRFFNDYRFADLYTWQIHRVPELYPTLMDGYNISSHLHTRSILYGHDPNLEKAIAGVGIGAAQGAPGMTYHRVLLRSLVPQVWVSASTTRVLSNEWDAAEERLTTEIQAVGDGQVTYDWSWRSIDRIDPEAPAPDAGPRPTRVRVNGEEVAFEKIQGGWWRVVVPAEQGSRIRIEVQY